MAKYVLIYRGGKMPETDEEYAAVLKDWQAWYENLGEAVVDPGYPLSPMAKIIDADGSVSDGAGGVLASGYTILEADSMDGAVEMAQDCPVLNGGAKIEVYETIEMM